MKRNTCISAASPIRGLYLLTDTLPEGELDDWVGLIGHLLCAGVDVLQLRDKGGVVRRHPGIGQQLLALCESRGVPLIVNDDIELARELGAAGVHLGRDDGSIDQARERLGDAALIGVSCYDSLERARAAAAAGADYVAFGSCFPSPTKPDAPPVPPAALQAARQALNIPIVAIGGITADNMPPLLRLGVDAIAVIDAVFGAPDPVAAVRRFSTGLGGQWSTALHKEPKESR